MKAKIGNRLIASLKPQEKPLEICDTSIPGFIVRVQPSGIMTYICSYRLRDGRRNRVSIGRASVFTPAQARDRVKELLADVTKGTDPVEARKLARSHTLKTFLKEEYEPKELANHKSGNATLKRLQACFAEFENKKLSDLNTWIIDKWKSERQKSGIKAATISRDITALKALLYKAVQWKFIATNPLAKYSPFKNADKNRRVRYLSPDEESALRKSLDDRQEQQRKERDSANQWRKERGYAELIDLRALPLTDHLKPLVLLALNTGCRRGELFKLRWEKVDFSRSILTVDWSTTKNEETRHIPLNAEALEVLQTWHKQRDYPKDGYVFPGKDGCALNNIKKSWAPVINASGISDFRFHDIRHHFASRLVMAGVDLNTVRELLGHGDIKMTLRYAHLAPHAKAEAVARLIPPSAIHFDQSMELTKS
ncbi:MAG: site-specific integrase [Deltaproteobacteria bacterium]|nr:site-specific integrase [Deltaproteobacteria bacterium]